MSARVATVLAITTLAGLFGLGWYVDHVARQELTGAIKLLIAAATCVGLLLLVILAGVGGLIGWERWRTARGPAGS